MKRQRTNNSPTTSPYNQSIQIEKSNTSQDSSNTLPQQSNISSTLHLQEEECLFSQILYDILTPSYHNDNHNHNDNGIKKNDNPENFEIKVSNSIPIDTFFDTQWQKEPKLYSYSRGSLHQKEHPKQIQTLKLDEILQQMQLDGLLNLLENSRISIQNQSSSLYIPSNEEEEDEEEETHDHHDNNNNNNIQHHSSSCIIFQNNEALQPEFVQDTYNNNPFAAYLDGCSLVINHADLISPPLASLAMDLQRSLPHVYINTYLTPPKSSAVLAHADDRDVFVLQLIGSKCWKVYHNVPIPYPYTHEQVGKGTLPVPEYILNSKNNPLDVMDIILYPGDVLYIPRGYVHEAHTFHDTTMSFHATIAVATHDWTLAKLITDLANQSLNQIASFRMAVHPYIGTANNRMSNNSTTTNTTSMHQIRNQVQQQIDDAFQILRDNINVDSIESILRNKYKYHNEMSDSIRLKIMNQHHDPTMIEYNNKSSNVTKTIIKNTIKNTTKMIVTGPKAAQGINLNTIIRSSTQIERDSVPIVGEGKRGLTVREETCDALLSIVSCLKNDLSLQYRVSDLRSIMNHQDILNQDLVCDLTLMSFVKCCVELGAMAIVSNC